MFAGSLVSKFASFFVWNYSADLVQAQNKWIGYQDWSSSQLAQQRERCKKIKVVDKEVVQVLDCGIRAR